ncbi:MAG: hypothetical protein HY232_17515 [Acidobacteria bacterium]|nr:hypothetical protein [Acidobacteriota bacterium]
MLDLHAHYLPGVDDGPKTKEESLEMLRMAAADGIRTVVATPHMFIDTFRENTVELIQENYASFLLAIQNEGQDPAQPSSRLPEVLLGAENFVNERFVLALEKGISVLTLNRSSYLLMEFPLFAMFNHFDRLLSILFARGLTPIFAHPERNGPFQRDPKLLHRLVAQGVGLQLDSMSLLGGFGPEAKELAFYLLKNNLAHLIGSDTHGSSHRRPMLSQARALAAKTIGEAGAELLVRINPERILRGDEMLNLDEAVDSTAKKKSWLAAVFGRS